MTQFIFLLPFLFILTIKGHFILFVTFHLKFVSIRTLIALATCFDWEIEQMDVKTAFLNGDLNEDIYMLQPEGFQVGNGNLVCKLRKSLYGLKQAGRQWYQKIDSVLTTIGFNRSKCDNCVYIYAKETQYTLYIALYVDDLLIIGDNINLIKNIKTKLGEMFEMKDLGAAHFILGIEITRNRQQMVTKLSQLEYINRVLKRFGMDETRIAHTPLSPGIKLFQRIFNGKPTSEPYNIKEYQSAVGSLMYAMLGTRPDLAYSVTALSQFNVDPSVDHWKSIKHIFRYLSSTKQLCLTYSGKTENRHLYGFTDSDWGGDNNDRRSISAYTFLLAHGAVSWQSKKQKTVALSSVEAEYMASTAATKEALWFRQFLSELMVKTRLPIPINSDSRGAIALTKNPEYHSRTKHIDIQYHFVRNHVIEGRIVFNYCPTSEMVADALTKAISTTQHNMCIDGLGLRL
jgi:hypothetical protein